MCINAVIKSAMRLSQLYSYLQDWRYEYSQAMQKPPDDRPKFAPSKIALHQGITWFLAACIESFSSSKVRQGMARCFIKVGLLRDNLNYFQLYPLQHPSSYSKWVESLMHDAMVPTYADECEKFHFTELFDELEFVTDMPHDDTYIVDIIFPETESSDSSEADDASISDSPPAVVPASQPPPPPLPTVVSNTVTISFPDGTTITHAQSHAPASAPQTRLAAPPRPLSSRARTRPSHLDL